MNPALMYYPRSTRALRQTDPEPETVAAALRETDGRRSLTEAASGNTIGFWAIPDGSGGYLKLKILDQYRIRDSAGSLSSKLPTNPHVVPGFDPALPFPVMAVVQNRKLLSGHFRWIQAATGSGERDNAALYDPDHQGHEHALESLNNLLIRRGWRYVVVRGDAAYTGGRSSQGDTLNAILAELYDGKEQRPVSVKLDVSGVTKWVLLNAAGEETAVKSVDEMRNLPQEGEDDKLSSKLPNQEQSPREIELLVKEALQNSDPGLALGVIVKYGTFDKMQHMSHELLDRVLAPVPVNRSMSDTIRLFGVANQIKTEKRIANGVRAFLSISAQNGVNDYDPDDYPKLDLEDDSVSEGLSLTEASYLDLWNSTLANGQYRHGGMYRLRGRWVYDPTVPGRTRNGSRFVTVASPKPAIDSDGKIVLRFRYQSRPNRNTTGMAQVGYIKFRDHAEFLKTASRNIGRAISRKDVHVHCSCPDFQFRWHYVLSRNDAAPAPVGQGNAPPNRTNPRGLVAMCKHLTACSPFILMRPQSLDRELRRVFKSARSSAFTPKPKAPDSVPGEEAPDGSPVVRPGADIDTGTQEES